LNPKQSIKAKAPSRMICHLPYFYLPKGLSNLTPELTGEQKPFNSEAKVDESGLLSSPVE
jgi:hypothetical protein